MTRIKIKRLDCGHWQVTEYYNDRVVRVVTHPDLTKAVQKVTHTTKEVAERDIIQVASAMGDINEQGS